MKPIDKGVTVTGIRKHGDAKPELLVRLGEFCSYCECTGRAQQLHVEHIYPQAESAHPKKGTNWRNFLLACATCNTYKRLHLGDGQQTGLLKRYLWPHIDNTMRSFEYLADGRVLVAAGMSAGVSALADATREMIGLMRSPAAAENYHILGIAYDGVEMRKEAWGIAERARTAFDENPSPNQLAALCDSCKKTGHFSVWMTVFSEYPEVRNELINTCKAASVCFDAHTLSVPRGRT